MALFLNLPVTTTEDIALAVRAELATELARVDVAVSTRATPAQIAAVQADTDDIQATLAARLDVAVSTRAPETDTDAILAALGGTVQPSGEVE